MPACERLRWGDPAHLLLRPGAAYAARRVSASPLLRALTPSCAISPQHAVACAEPVQKRPNSSMPAPSESITGAADQLGRELVFGAIGAAPAEPVSMSRPSTMANKPPA